MPNADPIGVIYTTDPFWSQTANLARKALHPAHKLISLSIDCGVGFRARVAYRRAVKTVTDQGAKQILVFSQNVDLLPGAEARYLIFADATLAQRYWLENRRPPGAGLKSRVSRVRALAAKGHQFLPFSMFAAHGVAEEYRAPLSNIHLMPFPVDIADPERKGGKSASPATRHLKVLVAFQNGGRAGYEALMQCIGPEVQWECFEYEKCPDFQNFAESARAADVVGITSEREPYPVAALLSVAAGIPTVVSNIGAAAEIIRDGIDGFVLGRVGFSAVREAITQLLPHAPGETDEGRPRQLNGAHSLESFAADVNRVLGDLGT